MCAVCDMGMHPGHYGYITADQETVRSHAMAKHESQAETTWPATCGWRVTTCSISWPVIDASFRYSMFMYGALVVNAPFGN